MQPLEPLPFLLSFLLSFLPLTHRFDVGQRHVGYAGGGSAICASGSRAEVVDDVLEEEEIGRAVVSFVVIDMLDVESYREVGGGVPEVRVLVVAPLGAKGGHDDTMLVTTSVFSV